MALIHSWVQIPDRSKLQISAEAESPDDEFVVSARIHDEEGNESELDDSKLRPGPGSFLLRSPLNYSARMRVGFLSKKNITVTVSVTIIRPDGSVHGAVFSEEIVGKAEDVVRVTLFARTLSSD